MITGSPTLPLKNVVCTSKTSIGHQFAPFAIEFLRARSGFITYNIGFLILWMAAGKYGIFFAFGKIVISSSNDYASIIAFHVTPVVLIASEFVGPAGSPTVCAQNITSISSSRVAWVVFPMRVIWAGIIANVS